MSVRLNIFIVSVLIFIVPCSHNIRKINKQELERTHIEALLNEEIICVSFYLVNVGNIIITGQSSRISFILTCLRFEKTVLCTRIFIPEKAQRETINKSKLLSKVQNILFYYLFSKSLKPFYFFVYFWLITHLSTMQKQLRNGTLTSEKPTQNRHYCQELLAFNLVDMKEIGMSYAHLKYLPGQKYK